MSQPRRRKRVLRTPVDIQSQIKTKDDRAGYTLDFSTIYSTRAERTELGGGETLRAAALTSTYMRRYELRWPPSIALSAAQRLVDKTDGRAYNIRFITGPDQYSNWVTLTCEYVPGSAGA